MKDKKLFLNTLSSFSYQIISIICAFILPRCFLVTYGSEVNGLVTSITQFLGFISLMDLGISAVVKAALYKPLAEKDKYKIDTIMTSAKKFFNKIILIFLLYLIGLCCFYPMYFSGKFDWLYTASLILAMSISLISQYYFGIVNQTLLEADQKNYIPIILQIGTLILNTLCGVVLMMKFDASIQIVKLTTSIIFLIRPVVMSIYVRKIYNVKFNCKYSEEPIKQKWNGIAQHLASVVLQNTDVLVLTFFSSLSSVSIYNVYSLVVLGVRNIVVSLTAGIQSKFGALIVKEDFQLINDFYGKIEWILHSVITILFTSTAILIVPFVLVYTEGINDANYNLPWFGILLTISHMFYCLRLPYSMIVLAAGHFKETQTSAIVEMLLNILISIVLVKNFSLIGVAIGTIVAMCYRTIYYVKYISRNILNRSVKYYIKHMMLDGMIFIISFYLCKTFVLESLSYVSWIFLAIKVVLVVFIVFMFFNMIFYKNHIKNMVLKRGKK